MPFTREYLEAWLKQAYEGRTNCWAAALRAESEFSGRLLGGQSHTNGVHFRQGLYNFP